jgi:hypothetical protein
MTHRVYHPITEATTNIAQINISKFVEPFLMTLTQDMSPQCLNSTFAAVFGFGPEATFTLHKTTEDGEPPVGPMPLASLTTFPTPFSGDFRLSAAPPKVSIDGRYDALRNMGASVRPGLTPEAFFSFVFEAAPFDSYLFQLTLHRFLYRALIDLIHESAAPIARSILPYFADDASTNTPKRAIARHALRDVFSVVLGDEVLWGRARSPTTVPEWPALIAVLAGMVRTGRIGARTFSKALSPFRPTALSERLPLAIIAKLRETIADADLFRIASDIFPDSFFWHCFAEPAVLFRAITSSDLVPIFPFIAIRCHVLESLARRIEADVAIAIITQIGLPALAISARIVNAVIDPIFDYIYDNVLNDPLPYLEMSAAQLKRIVDDVLTPMTPIMKETISRSRDIQVSVLVRLQQLLAKREFEPKGLCFSWFAFLYDRGIVHDTAFNLYAQGTRTHSPGKNSVMLEINSFLLTLIPGPFPDLNRDSQTAPKRPPGPRPPKPH